MLERLIDFYTFLGHNDSVIDPDHRSTISYLACIWNFSQVVRAFATQAMLMVLTVVTGEIILLVQWGKETLGYLK